MLYNSALSQGCLIRSKARENLVDLESSCGEQPPKARAFSFHLPVAAQDLGRKEQEAGSGPAVAEATKNCYVSIVASTLLESHFPISTCGDQLFPCSVQVEKHPSPALRPWATQEAIDNITDFSQNDTLCPMADAGDI